MNDSSCQPEGQFDRRRVLQWASGAVTAAVANRWMPIAQAADVQSTGVQSAIIDCHAHIYGEDDQRYPTIAKPYRPPPGMGTVAHLRREMQSAGVGRVTAIHTSTYYRWDNRFTADSARDNSDVMVGICTLDPDDDKSPALLEQYVRDFNIRGMRSIPAQSGRLDDPGVDRLWKMAEELGIVINVLTNREKQSEIEALAGRHPMLRVVIDHCLNLRAGPELDPTLDAMRDLARLERAYAKLSFIPTGSSQQFPCRDMHAPCRAVIGFFGPERCVWGSDFPCQLWCPNVTYSQNLRILTHELGLDEAARRAILAETPRRLWFAPLAT